MTGTQYQRLTRRRRTLTGSSDLWLADDHLLLAVRNWWVERYQRFRLTEIQSIVVSERPGTATVRISALVLTAIVFVAVVLVPGSLAFNIFAGTFFWLLLIWQAADLSRGAYCRVVLTTAVTSARLPAISRLRIGLSFVERILPAIQTAQQGLLDRPPPLPRTEAARIDAVPAEVSTAPDISPAPSMPPASISPAQSMPPPDISPTPSMPPPVVSPPPLSMPPPIPQHPRRNRVPLELMMFLSAAAFGSAVIADLNLKVSPAFRILVYTLGFAPFLFAGVVAFRAPVVWALSRPFAWGIGLTSLLIGATYFAAWVQMIQALARGQLTLPEEVQRYRPGWFQQGASDLSAILVVMGLAGLVTLLLKRHREPNSGTT